MRYIHSIWSTPSIDNKAKQLHNYKDFNKNFYSYFFSALLIKKMGYEIDLYCDEKSVELYSLIPYNNIHIVDFDNEGISHKFWMWGKIKTQSLINEPYVHIDGDVFFFKDIIGNKIFNGEYDSVVQNVENSYTMSLDGFKIYYPNSSTPFKKYFDKYGIKWSEFNIQGYNAGVVGFHNIELKNKYIDRVTKIIGDLSKETNINEIADKYIGINVIAEQALLYHTLNINKTKILEILPYEIIKNTKLKWYETIAPDLGFCHMLGVSKYRNDIILAMKNKINKMFPTQTETLNKFECKYL